MTTIGVISDTHGDIEATRQAVVLLDSMNVSLTIHCGDVGPDIVRLFGGRPLHFVAGNMDADDPSALATADAEHTFHDLCGSIEVDGLRIAFLHGHDVRLLRHTIQSGQWHLVCHGHTHSFSSSREGQTLILNPGALSRTRYPSLAIVELPSLEVTQLSL
jgi:uncharacterized protein